MSWEKKQGREFDYIDGETGHHVMHLINAETGAEHRIQIALGHDACPHCGGVHALEGIDSIDPQEQVSAELSKLNERHEAIKDYAAKHGLTVRAAK